MTERKFTAEDGRTWVFRVRPEVRRNEVGNHVTLELATHNESRVLIKRDGEWQIVHVHKSPAWSAPFGPE